ncbi:MAG: beta-ribofuranosylaminobenzene 5'-phosphate synthase family protein [Phycisphaerae bacterium]|jgi:beta-ribofuranosylaminobenzene 5'-phosphate synthase
MGKCKVMSLNTVIIEVNARLHLTLIGMNNEGYRINGGVGFAVKNPSLRLRFSRSREFILEDIRRFPFLENEILRIIKIVEQEKNLIKARYNIRVEITGEMPTHFGFGSSSATRLACLEALYLLNNKKPERERLVFSSGRGGTSGIGINAYFEGGLIIDLGRRGQEFFSCPSQLSEKRKSMPLMMQRIETPDWEIGICIPNNIPHKTEKEEADFFKKTCPVSSSAVYKTLYHVIYGLYSAVRENDKKTFCLALQSIQRCAWKLAERKQYGKNLFRIEQKLYKCGAEAVGMSSLGPSLFFLAKDVKAVIEKMKTKMVDCTLIATKPANSGRNIIYV